MLVAGIDDVIEVDGHGEMTVVDRQEPYYGPVLKLAGDDGESYKLLCPGFASELELWRAVSTDGFIDGWNRVGNVSAEISQVGNAFQCECGEVVKTLREKRAIVVGGVCIHT
jgi:hypothetical protein